MHPNCWPNTHTHTHINKDSAEIPSPPDWYRKHSWWKIRFFFQRKQASALRGSDPLQNKPFKKTKTREDFHFKVWVLLSTKQNLIYSELGLSHTNLTMTIAYLILNISFWAKCVNKVVILLWFDILSVLCFVVLSKIHISTIPQ